MEYKVIPFVASINHTKGTSNHVAEQLEEIILIKAGSMFDQKVFLHMCKLIQVALGLAENRDLQQQNKWLFLANHNESIFTNNY